MMPRTTLVLVFVLSNLVPAVAAANDWPQFMRDETHQSSVPGSQNAELAPFIKKWWNNVSVQGPVGSPAIRENVVYFGDASGRLHAFDQESGGILWSNTTGASRISGAPAVGPDFVYVLNEAGSLYSFDRKKGDLRQGYPIAAGASFGSVMLHEDGEALYVGSVDGSVKSYFADTKQLRWTFTGAGTWFTSLTCTGGSIDGTPAVFEQWVFFGSTNHCFFAVPRSASGTITAPTWGFMADEAIRSSPTIDKANRRVIFGDNGGNVYAIPVASSGKVNTSTWKYVEPSPAGISAEFKASPAISGTNVIVASRNGNVTALPLSGGSKVWVRNLNEAVTSTPAIANGRVMVGSFDRKMYMLKTSDGTDADTPRAAGAEIETSPAISGTQVLWASKDGVLHSWGGQKPDRPDLAVVAMSAGSPVAGRAGAVAYVVKNVGPLPSPATSGSLFIGGTAAAEFAVPALEPGAEASGAIDYTPSVAGPVVIRLLVDSTRTVQEADEANNERVITASVSQPLPSSSAGSSEEGAPGVGPLALVLLLAVVAWVRRRR